MSHIDVLVLSRFRWNEGYKKPKFDLSFLVSSVGRSSQLEKVLLYHLFKKRHSSHWNIVVPKCKWQYSYHHLTKIASTFFDKFWIIREPEGYVWIVCEAVEVSSALTNLMYSGKLFRHYCFVLFKMKVPLHEVHSLCLLPWMSSSCWVLCKIFPVYSQELLPIKFKCAIFVE